MAEQAGVASREPGAKRRLLWLMALFLMVGGGAVTAITLVLWLLGRGSALDPLGALAPVLLGLLIFLLNRSGHYQTAGLILVILLMMVPAYYVLLEGPKSTAILLFAGGVLYADFLLGGRSGLIVAVGEGLLYLLAGLGYSQGLLQSVAYISPFLADLVTVVAVSFALAFTAGYFTREMKRALEDSYERGQALQAADAETNRLLAEIAQRDEEQSRLLEQVQELGNPIIPLSAGVMAMPIVGLVDARRAGQVTSAFLHGLEEKRVRVAIVDITGVPVVDALFCMTLLQMAQGAQLLGVAMVLTGIRPQGAGTIVDLGLDLKHIRTRATLQEGLDDTLRRRPAGAAPRP